LPSKRADTGLRTTSACAGEIAAVEAHDEQVERQGDGGQPLDRAIVKVSRQALAHCVLEPKRGPRLVIDGHAPPTHGQNRPIRTPQKGVGLYPFCADAAKAGAAATI
jgi:hypothetical protein